MNALNMSQLKYLAKDHYVKLKPRVKKEWFSETVIRPSKRQYVNALAKTLTAEEIRKKIARMPKPEKKRRKVKKRKGSFWW